MTYNTILMSVLASQARQHGVLLRATAGSKAMVLVEVPLFIHVHDAHHVLRP
jgi:hypothetical protein